MILYGRRYASELGAVQLPAGLHYKACRSDFPVVPQCMILVYRLATGADEARDKRKDLE